MLTNLFATSTNDQSIYYLGRIFGSVGDVLAGTGPVLLGKMFTVFNTAVLSLGALVIAYTTIISVLSTAHEGEFLGKKFHGLWVPIRSVLGISTLLPMASGYCVIQVIMMWFIVQGVGAADTMWNTVIDYFEGGGAISTPAPSSYLTGGQYTDFTTIFKDLSCQAAIKKFNCPNSAGSLQTWCNGSVDFLSNITSNSTTGMSQYTMGPNGDCDSLQWSNTDATDQAKYAAYQTIMPTFIQIAGTFVDSYYAFVSNTPDWVKQNPNMLIGTSPSTAQIGEYFWTKVLYPYTGTNFIRDAVNAYMGQVLNQQTSSSAGVAPGKWMGQAATAVLTGGVSAAGALASNLTLNVNATLENARANGWIFAGGYYYFIASMSNSAVKKNIASARPDIVQQVPGGPLGGNPSSLSKYAINGVNQVFNVYQIADSIASTAKAAQDAGRGEGTFAGAANATSGNVVADALMSAVSLDLSAALIGGFMAMISNVSSTTPTNPIVNLQAFGEAILIISQVILIALIVALFSVSIATSFMACVQPMPYAIANVSQFIVPVVMFLLLALFSFGATLGVYVPLIPYIIFTMGALGWFIATIETMIAAPIVAIGILSPGGHEILGGAQPAMMLILNIFLRPTLMVFGMMAGMLLSYVLVSFVNAAYLGVMMQIYSGPGLVETILFIATYCFIIITGLNKCFSLIHLIPDQVMRWLSGGQQGAFGAETKGAEGEIKGAVTGAGGAADQIKGGAGKVGGEAEKHLGEGKKAKSTDAKIDVGGPKKG